MIILPGVPKGVLNGMLLNQSVAVHFIVKHILCIYSSINVAKIIVYGVYLRISLVLPTPLC